MPIPDKSGFPHYMLKEIYENPRAVRDTVVPRIDREAARVVLEGIRIGEDEFRDLCRITIAASGTSRHAGMAGRVMMQHLANIPVDVDWASEFEYRNPMTGPGELCIVITQSGETADTTGALREARHKGARVLAITNVLNSTIGREADAVIDTKAGPEISIASTKAFTAQLAALYLFSVYLGQVRGQLNREQSRHWIDELLAIPAKLETALRCDSQVCDIASRFQSCDDFLFIGRGIHLPIALDGALKLKEVSYIHAEGYPAGEIKHGPYALIDEHMPLVALAARDESDEGSVLRYQKTLSGLREVKAARGRIIAVAVEGDTAVPAVADHVIFIPPAPELLLPLLEIVPLQLLAYHIASQRGLDVDRPRNLVKAVTEE